MADVLTRRINMKRKVSAFAGIPISLALMLAFESVAIAQDDSPSGNIKLEVCNYSGNETNVAVDYKPANGYEFTRRGWFKVANGRCRIIASTSNAVFDLYAEATEGSRRVWGGSYATCVQYPGPFTFVGASRCDEELARGFARVVYEGDTIGTYTWTLRA